MSAIAGIWNWNGKPVTEAEIAALASQSRPSGSDDGLTVNPRPGLVLQAHVLRFDQFSATERQPWTFARGLVLTWDGRLDNREDLLLVLHPYLNGEKSDVAIVAAAYQRWGLECLGRLVGDWSLALWDADAERLILARDLMGNRPLYYMVREDGIAWATSLDALASCFNLYSHLDDTFVAGRLIFGTPPEVTPYRNVRLLKNGHRLVATKKDPIAISRHWIFSPDVIRYRKSEDYIDHLRMLLTEAIRVRLRAHGTVWAHSSGGWDSSAIACIAQRLIEHGDTDASSLRTLTTMWPPPFQHAEDEYVRAVEKTIGIDTIKRVFPGHPSFDQTLGLTHPDALPESHLLERHVIEAGDNVLLSGVLGNQTMWLSGADISIFEPLSAGHPIDFIKLCFRRAAHHQRPLVETIWSLLRELCISPDLRAHQKPSIHPLASPPLQKSVVMKETHDATYGLTAKVFAAARPVDYSSDLSTDEFPIVKRRVVRSFYRIAASGLVTSPSYTPKVWYTFPFTHRPLLEFVLATPQMAFWDPTIVRSAMRRALNGILPDQFLTRATKGSIAPAATRANQEFAERVQRSPLLQEPASSWELVKHGYLDAALTQHAINTWRESLHPEETLKSNWIRMEAWLRTIAARDRHRDSNARQHCAVST